MWLLRLFCRSKSCEHANNDYVEGCELFDYVDGFVGDIVVLVVVACAFCEE